MGWTQGIFYAVGGAAAFLLGFGTLFGTSVLTLVACVGRMAEMCASCATWVHTPELFPTNVRGTAHSLLNLSSKVGAVASQYLISNAFTHFQRSAIMAGFSLAAAVASMFLTETAGKNLSGFSESDEDGEDDSSSSS